MKKYSLIYLIIGFGILILITQKFLLPLVYDVVKSDAFLKDSKDQASQYPVSNDLTNIAFLHCNSYIKSEYGADKTFSFSNKPLKAWSLGNYHYLINAEVNVTSDGNASIKKYVCRITYDNGDKLEGIQDFNNWSIEGIDGLEN